MSGFSIKLADGDKYLDNELVAVGNIQIGSFNEEFQASLSYWSRENYQTQWMDAVYKLINGEDKVALITSMYPPKTANFIIWWMMYRIGENVHVQNQVLFLDELDKDFEEENVYQFIPERETVTEDGDVISEWIISLKDIIDSIDNN